MGTVGEPPSQEPIRLRQYIFSYSDDTEYICGIKCVPSYTYWFITLPLCSGV